MGGGEPMVGGGVQVGGKVGEGPGVWLGGAVSRAVRVGLKVRVGMGVHVGTTVSVGVRVGLGVGGGRAMAWVGVGFGAGRNPFKREGEKKATTQPRNTSAVKPRVTSVSLCHNWSRDALDSLVDIQPPKVTLGNEFFPHLLKDKKG